MLKLALSYDNLTALLSDCRIVLVGFEDYPKGLHGQLGELFFIQGCASWEEVEGYHYSFVKLRKDDSIFEQAKSIGHEIAHLITDYLRVGNEPREKWPEIPALIRKIMWKEEEEEICDLFAERWLRLNTFKPTLFRFILQLRRTDHFFILS